MASDKLAKIVKALLYILAVTPLVAIPWTIFPFVFGRGLVMQFLIEIIFALYAVLAIFDKNFRPRKNILTGLLGLFLLVLLVSSFFGADFRRSFWSDEERFTGWFFLLHIFLFFLVIISVFRTKKDWAGYLKFSVSVSLAMFGVAILSLFGVKFWSVDLGERISGTLGNPIFMAAYFIFNAVFALCSFFWSETKPKKAFWLSCAAILFYGTFLTQSRGAFLGIIAGAAVGVFYFGIFAKNKKAKIAVFSAAAIAIAAIGSAFVFKNSSFVRFNSVLNKITDISLSADTARTRILSWQIAWEAIRERPVLGWGVEGFYAAFDKYYKPELLRYSYYETWSDKPHNAFLEIGTDAGITGIIVYLAVFAAAVRLIYQKKKIGVFSPGEAAVLTGGLVAYFTQNLFAFDTDVSYLLFFLLLAFIGRSADETEKRGERVIKKYALIFPMAAVFGATLLNFSPLLASVKLSGAFSPEAAGKKIDLPVYKKFSAYFNPYREEWRNDLAKSVTLSFRSGTGLYNRDEAEYVAGELAKSAAAHPGSAYYHLLLGSLYMEMGALDNKYLDSAKVELDRALALSPKRQHIYFALGRYYAFKNNKDEMTAAYEEAIALEPRAAIAYWEGAKQLFFADVKDPKAMEWLRQAASFGYVPQSKDELLFIFQNTYGYFLNDKRYDVLNNFYAQWEQIEPAEVKWHAQRAMVLYLMKRYDEAVQEINAAMTLDASYRAEGEQFIRLIEGNK